MSGNKGGFRGFASKLRDQAKDVVGNYKLPTFDDMAKNDDYIHSPDFNVRGSGYTGKSTLRQEEDSNAENSTNGTSLNGTTDEASHYSTESSWSLLDRPRKTPTATSIVAMPEQKGDGKEDMNNRAPQRRSYHVDESNVPGRVSSLGEKFASPSVLPSSSRQTEKKSSGSLLTVVSDALNPTTSVEVGAEAARKNLGDNRGQDEHSMAKVTDQFAASDDDSDQSSDSDDEEDPIFSLLQADNNKSNKVNSIEKQSGADDTPTSVIMIKSANRFMEDIRLQGPVRQNHDSDAIMDIQSTIARTNETEIETKSGNITGLFSGRFKNSMIQNFNRIILRQGSNNKQVTTQQQLQPPPLARERTPKPEIEQLDSFHITASTSVGILGAEDLEQLKQLKIAGESSAFSSISTIKVYTQDFMDYLRGHRYFLVVAFTLVLYIFVYLRRSKT